MPSLYNAIAVVSSIIHCSSHCRSSSIKSKCLAAADCGYPVQVRYGILQSQQVATELKRVAYFAFFPVFELCFESLDTSKKRARTLDQRTLFADQPLHNLAFDSSLIQ